MLEMDLTDNSNNRTTIKVEDKELYLRENETTIKAKKTKTITTTHKKPNINLLWLKILYMQFNEKNLMLENLLTYLLNAKDKDNIVKVRYAQMAKDTKLTLHFVQSTMTTLLTTGILLKVKNGNYKFNDVAVVDKTVKRVDIVITHKKACR